MNKRLINEVAVGIVFVQGPTSDLQMSYTERVRALAEVQQGLNWLATLEPKSKVSWAYDDKTVTISQAPWEGAPWSDLPREFYQKKVDAALWRDSNNRIYFFHNDQYIRLTGSTMDAGYPKPIAGQWRGIPSDFEQGIDAAFWRKTNNRIYMFKGSQYIRLTETEMDSGYPKPIAGNWRNLPGSFEEGIEAAFMHHGTNKIYMFKDSQYVRLTGSTMDDGYPRSIKGNFKGLPKHMQSGIHSALWRGSNNRIYLFDRHPRRTLTDYVRFGDITKPIDNGYPRYVGGLDRGEVEKLWRNPAQSKLGVGSDREGYKNYVDKLRHQFGTESGIVAFITKYPVGWHAYASTPKIVMAWKKNYGSFDRVFAHETGHTFGAPDEYSSSDCTCDKTYGRFFSAKNGNCKLCATAVSMNGGYPNDIAGNWKGLPDNFNNGIDAALWRNDNNKAYFFKGDKYVRLTNVTMDANYPRPIAGNWRNLPNNFKSGIDAAVWRRSNNRIYMFKGSQYIRLTETKMDANYPRPIAGNWKNLPSEFEQGIDGALWRESNDKIYMFKGNKYVRFTEATMDANYPRSITGNWKDLTNTFNSGINAAFTHRERNAVYLFRGSEYVRMSNGVPCLMASNSSQLCAYTPLHLGWGAFLTKIDAAVWRRDNNKTYLFSGDWYVRYTDIKDGMDEGYPKRISKEWKNLPSAFGSDIDAALYHESKDKLYFFKGNQYIRLTGPKMDAGYPKPIAGQWRGVPSDFEQGIDSTFWRESKGKVYMFKGDQYIRLSGTEMDSGYPKPIAGNWPGLSSRFESRIDAALMRWDTHKIYFFNDRNYVRYSNVSEGIDANYPRFINKNWMPFPT